MPREISNITKRDMQIYKLGKQVLKVVKTKKEWSEFNRYMKVYYVRGE